MGEGEGLRLNHGYLCGWLGKRCALGNRRGGGGGDRCCEIVI